MHNAKPTNYNSSKPPLNIILDNENQLDRRSGDLKRDLVRDYRKNEREKDFIKKLRNKNLKLKTKHYKPKSGMYNAGEKPGMWGRDAKVQLRHVLDESLYVKNPTEFV